MSQRRFLHFVFKIGDRKESIKFYRSVLGMKVLRHEEFEEGCKASCNGPFDGKWSKTMVGYGPELNHFVVELTYNYGLKSYKLGNDFLGFVIKSEQVLPQAERCNWPVTDENGSKILEAPGGFRFLIEMGKEGLPDGASDPVQQVILASSNLQKSIKYWNGVLGMEIYEQTDNNAVLGYGKNQCKLKLQDIGTSVNHEEAYGRIAFACPTAELPSIEAKVKNEGYTILTPLVTLETPGKAAVQVVILADPDGHEICFVGDEAFKELSEVDPKADELLDAAMQADYSDEWFANLKPVKKDGN